MWRVMLSLVQEWSKHDFLTNLRTLFYWHRNQNAIDSEWKFTDFYINEKMVIDIYDQNFLKVV